MTRRALTAGVLCAAMALPFGLGLSEAGAAPLPTATSQSDESRPTVMGTVSEDSGLSVSINSLSPRIITDENELVITGTVRNDSPTTLANISLEVFVANETPISVPALTTALSDDEPDATHAASSSLTDVARGATTSFEIRIPTSSLPLTDAEEWGPRVTTVTATSGEYSGKDRSIIVWDSGAQVSASRVSTVIPWTSTSTTQDQGERSAVLSLASASGVTLAVDPLLIPRGPQPTATPTPSASPSADAGQSGSGPAQSGQSDAESGQSDAPTASPSASTSTAGQSATTTFSPDSGPSILRNVAWPADTTFGTSFLSGFSSSDQITIAPVGALTPAEDVPFTSYARVNVDPATGETSTDGTGARTLAQQSDIAALLSWNASGGDELDAEQALTAITAIITRERPASSRTIFAAAQRGTVINERLTGRTKALFSPRWVSAMSFSEMAASEPTDVDRQTVGAGVLATDTETAISAMASSLTMLTPLAKATDDADAVYASVTPQILPALSAQLTPSEQLDAATAVTSQVTTMLSAVTVEPSSAVNLINKSANFPVLVRNNLPWPVRVDVTLVPDDPRLRATPAQSQTLAAQGATTVEVPVGAIGSGDIEVTYKVTTPDGLVLDDSQTVTVRMRAGWEDAITAVIASLFGLLFLAGITRSLRKRAARKAQAASSDADTTDITTETETATTKETP